MYRTAATILAVVAVSWHGIAVCCAHHGHSESHDSVHVHNAAESIVADGFASHHAEIKSVASSLENDEVFHGHTQLLHQCHGQQSRSCSEVACVFAAPEPPEIVDLEGIDWLSGIADDALLGILGKSSVTFRPSFDLAGHCFAAVRQHLALRVMLL